MNTAGPLHEPSTDVDSDGDSLPDNLDHRCLDNLTTESLGQHHSENVVNNDVDIESISNLNELFENTKLEELCRANAFIQELQNALLDGKHSNLNQKALDHLRNPPTAMYALNEKPKLLLAFDIFLASLTASVNVYNTTRASILRCHPKDNLPLYNQMKKVLTKITGVGSLVHPMCRNSCVAFTGPFTDLNLCPKCGELKHCSISGKYYQEFHTMPIGPILQALWRDPQSACRFDYCRSKMCEIIQSLRNNAGILSAYEDFFHGSDYFEQVQNGNIIDNNIVLMFSIDGAQLYTHKISDCWIYLWVILDFSPQERYKKDFVISGGFIPRPKKPKNIDSFLFPGLYHLASLQREGLPICNSITDQTFSS